MHVRSTPLYVEHQLDRNCLVVDRDAYTFSRNFTVMLLPEIYYFSGKLFSCVVNKKLPLSIKLKAMMHQRLKCHRDFLNFAPNFCAEISEFRYTQRCLSFMFALLLPNGLRKCKSCMCLHLKRHLLSAKRNLCT